MGNLAFVPGDLEGLEADKRGGRGPGVGSGLVLAGMSWGACPYIAIPLVLKRPLV